MRRAESAGQSTDRSRGVWASMGAADVMGRWHARMERLAQSRASIPASWIPQSGRIWTANARVVDGDMLARIGDGNYEVGSRARIIRNGSTARSDSRPRTF